MQTSPVRPAAQLLSVLLASACWFLIGPANAVSPEEFGFEQVAARAKTLASKPFQPPDQVPKFLRSVDFKVWRRIRYRSSEAQWRGRGKGFEAQFFHPGFLYDHAVPVHVINQYGVGRLPFEKKRFKYPDSALADRVPKDLGYAGLRLHYPINRDDYKDEVAVFLGASYFRAIGADQVYGLSARGLAVDTGLSSGEEFPYFRAFWLDQPAADAERMTIYALLESQSVTGAYRFVIDPGKSTVMNVQARLFTRKAITKLGIAPLTSMFMFGENAPKTARDFRPEVHDSDGLLLKTGAGEWIWRPLRNPDKLAINSFSMERLAGFGLLQRDRRFRNYQDLAAHYERRPGVWVVPEGDWGKGRVELVQIPSNSETNDNIVAFWVPAEPVKAGQTLDFAYRLHWQRNDQVRPPGARVVATRIGEAGPGTDNQPDKARKVMVDFKGGPLTNMPADAKVVPHVDVGDAARLTHAQVMHNEVTGGRRLLFYVIPDNPEEALELRAFLGDGEGGALSETWTYALQP